MNVVVCQYSVSAEKIRQIRMKFDTFKEAEAYRQEYKSIFTKDDVEVREAV